VSSYKSHADAVRHSDFYIERLEAENQHLRSLIAAYATEVLRSQPDQDAINAAASALVREVYGQR
jgi:hypothetical protein